jgi:uncharacterized protein with GYD domain
MPLYMTQFAYTPETWAALIRNPQDRSEALGGLLEKMGGRLISFYNCFGEYIAKNFPKPAPAPVAAAS